MLGMNINTPQAKKQRLPVHASFAKAKEAKSSSGYLWRSPRRHTSLPSAVDDELTLRMVVENLNLDDGSDLLQPQKSLDIVRRDDIVRDGNINMVSER